MMSKASEWVTKSKTRPVLNVPTSDNRTASLRAKVNDDGTVSIYIATPGSAQDFKLDHNLAYRLGLWLVDIFKETA